jgi:hypothetical protein
MNKSRCTSMCDRPTVVLLLLSCLVPAIVGKKLGSRVPNFVVLSEMLYPCNSSRFPLPAGCVRLPSLMSTSVYNLSLCLLIAVADYIQLPLVFLFSKDCEKGNPLGISIQARDRHNCKTRFSLGPV